MSEEEKDRQEAETHSLRGEERETESCEVSVQQATFQIDEPDRGRSMADNSSGGCILTIVLVIATIGALLVVILVPLSFSDLEYYEMGFAQRKSTGSIIRSKVYFGGRHFIGVDYKFKKFRADAHIEEFSKISVFNKEKLEITMTYAVQYFLIPEELRYLHDTYNLEYRPIIRETVSEGVKNAAVQFSVDQYRLDRRNVSDILFKAAKQALAGVCCFANCNKYKCLPGCKPYSTCDNTEKGMFAYVKFFQLEEVDISAEQEKKYLDQVIQVEKRETVSFTQKEKVERKITEQQKVKIENTALEVSQNATAKAGLLRSQAEADAKAIVEDSRNSGLQIIYSNLNITSEKHKKSLDYIRVLRNHKNAYMYTGFTTLVGREGK
eukprot:gene17303-19036_t